MAYAVMAYIVMAYIVMAYIVMAYMVMAKIEPIDRTDEESGLRGVAVPEHAVERLTDEQCPARDAERVTEPATLRGHRINRPPDVELHGAGRVDVDHVGRPPRGARAQREHAAGLARFARAADEQVVVAVHVDVARGEDSSQPTERYVCAYDDDTIRAVETGREARVQIYF